MSVAVVTGSAGLVGSEAVRMFAALGMDVVGIDNDMRRQFFGDEASTAWCRAKLERDLPSYTHFDTDVRDHEAVSAIFGRYGRSISVVLHAAAQPSHDWAAEHPLVDFGINANGTLHLLDATWTHCPDACFLFMSTNKVYGDRPNEIPLVELPTRWEVASSGPYWEGVSEGMSLDQSKHSLFGVSKVAADLLVQEYGRYFGMKSATFRAGCLTGPNQAGAQLHGFLGYLMKCTATGRPYTVLGYKGKQVRDNIHSADVVAAFYEVFRDPGVAEVYNIGGGRTSNCSIQEAIAMCEEIAGRELRHTYSDQPRSGDHIWYISDVTKLRTRYPKWEIRHTVRSLLEEMHDQNKDRWLSAV